MAKIQKKYEWMETTGMTKGDLIKIAYNNDAEKLRNVDPAIPQDEFTKLGSDKAFWYVMDYNNSPLGKLTDIRELTEPRGIILTHWHVGTVCVGSWGYEQTNIDFYKIIARKGQWVTIQKMTKTLVKETGWLSYQTIPNEIDPTEEPMRKKMRQYRGVENGFKVEYGGIHKWDGKPENETHYA